MDKEITELILDKEGFKIKETGELVEILGGENELLYTGYLNKNNKEFSKAISEIRWAISTDFHEFKKDYNGFIITGIKKMYLNGNISKDEEYGTVFYQALKYKSKK